MQDVQSMLTWVVVEQWRVVWYLDDATDGVYAVVTTGVLPSLLKVRFNAPFRYNTLFSEPYYNLNFVNISTYLHLLLQ